MKCPQLRCCPRKTTLHKVYVHGKSFLFLYIFIIFERAAPLKTQMTPQDVMTPRLRITELYLKLLNEILVLDK